MKPRAASALASASAPALSGRRVAVDQTGLEERARYFQTRSLKHEAKRQGLRLAVSMMDLTTLEGADTPGKVASVCQKAMHPMADRYDCPAVAAVCVYPSLVSTARRCLAGSGVRVASVATGFPSGQFPLALRLEDVRRAVGDGADEIDMVIDRGAWWPEDHTGEPLVAMEDREADQLGLKVGDRLRFDIMGTPVEARLVAIYSQRRMQSRLWLEAIFSDGVLDPFITRHVGAAWMPTGSTLDAQDRLAAAAILKGLTAWFLLRRTHRVARGGWVEGATTCGPAPT
mgnify:CR=1 FL=1